MLKSPEKAIGNLVLFELLDGVLGSDLLAEFLNIIVWLPVPLRLLCVSFLLLLLFSCVSNGSWILNSLDSLVGLLESTLECFKQLFLTVVFN